MYLFPIWNISGFFLSNLLEGNKKYSFQLKNFKKNTVVHSTWHLIAEQSSNFQKSVCYMKSLFTPSLLCVLLDFLDETF